MLTGDGNQKRKKKNLWLFLCYRCQCSGSRGVNRRTHGYVITKISRIYRLPFFSCFARARASLILILYNKKWLIINSAIFSNSFTVFAEMNILTLYGRPIWNDVRIHPHSSLDPFSFQFKLNKLVSNNVSKDISFQRYLVFDILTNPDRVTLPKR